ncbi:L-threonylcarbamoyladenylate synthase [Chitinivibrio alkaliphilus]|uniref:Threonylcarbamoyl-AMP synthase n=1 Tax=Chitinivibrio alkaliphilus ACht1 TaxID=1313304 RepID=U7D8D7_9BACT|nr:L-threonylcarbamoyladenylate synthase [Chitinivibrio alkaliphilus]ERP31332.1 Sua5/YciO/YrdC/YwlC family protein [Chitinivibrio alkaliphilus ACht1]
MPARTTKLLSPHEIDTAADIIRTGGLVAFPTETVYGLGANALDAAAARSIFTAKKRPSFDPLIVHLATLHDVSRVAADIPEKALKAFEAFWPGPFTAILPKKECVPDVVTAGLPTVGVRIPRNELAHTLIERSGCVVAAPSANLFSHTSPTTAAAVEQMLSGRIDAIVEGGACHVGVESTIVSFCEDPPVVYRAGGVSIEEVEACIGPVRTAPSKGDEKKAPGRSLRHYAPQTPLYLNAQQSDFPQGASLGLLAFGPEGNRHGYEVVQNLSCTGNLTEAARNLYAFMRSFDEYDLSAILVETIPFTGLGRAINDRLLRASEDGFKKEAFPQGS